MRITINVVVAEAVRIGGTHHRTLEREIQRPRLQENGDGEMVIATKALGCNDDAMALTIDCVLIDCDDLDAMTEFWCRALDFEHVWTGPSGGHLLAGADGSGHRLGLMPSHDKKLAKNRVHFDLRPDDQQAEVRRLEALGARRVDIGQAGVTWVVMADPEGNEFCVARSLADKARAGSSNS